MADRDEFARLLNQYLQKRDRSITWLAGRLGVAPSTVSRWSNGLATPQDLERVIRVADVLGIHNPVDRQRFVEAAGYVYTERKSPQGPSTAEIGADVDAGPVPTPKQPLPIRRLSGLGLLSALLLAVLLWAAWRDLPFQPMEAAATPSVWVTTPVEPTRPAQVSRCGEAEQLATPPWNRFMRTQGVSLYSAENTEGGLRSNGVRTLAIDARGLWIGYFTEPGGVGFYDKEGWADCTAGAGFPVERVNALAIDPQGRVWVGMEQRGIAVFDGQTWQRYTTANGLPDNGIFGLTVDNEGRVWAATWEGIARFDGDRWSVPYSVYNGTLASNHTHAIAFDPEGNIWVGTISRGLSHYRNDVGAWVHYMREDGTIGGNEVRDILVQPAGEGTPLAIWFATADGGVTRYSQGAWTVFGPADGLPHSRVTDLALDRYGRVWAATGGGVAYFDGQAWQPYTTLPAQAVAMGPPCSACPFDDDDVWTAASGSGLTHSGLPLPEPAIDVVAVQVPRVVRPGQAFRPAITVVPRAPYRLEEGDFLAHMDEADELRFGAYPHMAVRGVVEPGQPFTFTDYDNLFVAPALPSGEASHTYTSTWRVWMDNRYVGPAIPITFTVQAEGP